MPTTPKKTTRSTKETRSNKSAAQPASSTASRRSRRAHGRTSMRSRSKVAARDRGVREARGQRDPGGAVATRPIYIQWVGSRGAHEGQPGKTFATRDHDIIRQWAKERQAVPTTAHSTGRERSASILRLDFPGYGGNELGELTWDEWFETFDEHNLIFIFQEHKADGSLSHAFKLILPDH